ncbi:MAG: PEP-CTERM sorting domain-containing protein [Planctomycetaceae bacterium]|nr:PEP-CTERM sorting domain-containing protein [Planctomycetaceae bacterium]
MTRLICFAICCLGTSVTTVQAGSLVYRVSGQLTLNTGTDVLGLDGASFVFEATFDDAAVYSPSSTAGPVWVPAESESLTITRPAAPLVPETFRTLRPLYLVPAADGQFFDDTLSNPRWEISGDVLMLANLLEPVAGVGAGETISLTHFGQLRQFTGDLQSGAYFVDKTVRGGFPFHSEPLPSWGVSGVSSSGTVVPEPSSLALLGCGLFSLAGTKLRRRKRCPG